MEQQSYCHHATNAKHLYNTLTECLSQRSSEIPDTEAYVFRQPPVEDAAGPERSAICFRELEERSTQLAAAFLELGFEPEDRVAAIGPFCTEWVLMDYALLKIKVKILRLAAEITTANSLQPILEKFKCKALILHPGHTENFLQAVEERSPGLLDKDAKGWPEMLKFVLSMTNETALNLKCIQELLAATPGQDTVERVNEIQISISPDDVATIFMSSGSTGFPKAIPCSHFSLINNAHHTVSPALGGLQAGVSRYFIDRLPHWIAAFPFLPVVCGATYVPVDPRFTCNVAGKHNDFLFRVMHEEKVTCAMALPYLMYDIVNGIQKSGYRLPDQLTNIMTGGERLPIDLVRAMATHVPHLATIYGTTEVGLALAVEVDPQKGDADILEGRPCRHFEFKVVDDQGRIVGRETPGELLIRGPYIFSNYLEDAEKSAVAFTKGGWFRTSDFATMSSEGKVKVLARKSEVISVATRKVFPAEIERILVEHPGVAKAAVVGVADERMYEVPCACVVPTGGEVLSEEALRDHFRQSVLNTESFSLVPRHVFFVDTFPEVNGKVNRRKIKEMAAELFGKRE